MNTKVEEMTAKEQALPDGQGYTVERHGDGWAVYRGRDHEHHGWNIGRLTECSPELAAQIAAGLNALASRPADTGERGVVVDAMVSRSLEIWFTENVTGTLFERMQAVLKAALRAQPAGGGEDWQARALSAEADIERMTDAFNRENGPTFMGEPVLPPEKMVELEPGVRVPKWLLDDTRRVELYMKAHLPGPWRIGGIQSHDYANATPPESGGQGEKGRWFCDGPNGYFYSDDADAARNALNIIDPDGDDWTITDMHNPFGEAAIPARAEVVSEAKVRELLSAELEAEGYPSMAEQIRDESGYNTLGLTMVRVITSVLAAADKRP